MPMHCCVPKFTKKGYREDDGSKVSYFLFPTKKMLRKKWIHAIRREEGKHFEIKTSTKVCSRHFRKNDLKKSLVGKIYLRPGAVPSLFLWTCTSPRKRKAPTPREFGVGSSSRISPEKGPNEENVMDVSDYESFNVETTQLQGVEGDVNLNTNLAQEHLHKTPSKKNAAEGQPP